MRARGQLGALVLAILAGQPAFAQQRDVNNFLTGVRPEDVTFQKVIDVAEMSIPKTQQMTTDRLSVRQILSKFVPFLSPDITPKFATAVPLSAASNKASPLQP